MEIEESTNENKLKNSASHRIEMNDAGLSRTHFQWMCDGQFVGFWCHFCQREREKMNVCCATGGFAVHIACNLSAT
jgi:hypothetical protein